MHAAVITDSSVISTGKYIINKHEFDIYIQQQEVHTDSQISFYLYFFIFF